MKIAVEGATKLEGSYGIVNVNLAMALHTLGVDVILSPWDQSEAACRAALAEAFPAASIPVTTDDSLVVDVHIRQIWPPIWSRPDDGGRLVVIQPWEFGSVPLSWLPGISQADAVWVPSSFVKAGYIQSGVTPGKVWVVPNGTDVAEAEPPHRQAHEGPLSLLFLGGGIFRKGPDVLIEALKSLPPPLLQQARLTIKETGYDSYYRGQSLVDSSLRGAPAVAAITTVVREHLRRDKVAALVRSADVLVHPYRSEGFGLPILEAMALGTPVVVTAGGAADDFCGDDEGFLVPSDVAVGSTPFVGDTMTVDYPYFRAPRTQDLALVLAQLVGRQIDTAPKARKAWERARGFKWARVGEITLEALDALACGREPADRFTATRDAVAVALTGPTTPRALEAATRLTALGDHHSALRLLGLAKACAAGPSELSSVLRRQEGSAGGQADLWSGASWRLDIAAMSREEGTVPAIVHKHEGEDHATMMIASAIAPYFSSCESVLDMGCGQGSMMRTLRAQGKVVYGIEEDPVLVARLRAEGFTVSEGWIPEALEKLAFPRIDGIFLGHIVEHIPPDKALQVLRWAATHLNNDGVVVIQTPDFSVDLVSKSNFWLDRTNVRPYPVPLLKAMLESAGFAPLAGGCRSLAPVAPLDVLAVGRVRHPTVLTAPAKARTPAKTILHFGLFGNDSCVGRAGRTLFDEHKLADAGIEMIRVDLTAPMGSTGPDGTIPFIRAMETTADLAVVDVPVGWLPEVLPRVRAAKCVVRFAFEATPLPGYLAKALAPVEEIWAVSQYAASAATGAGLQQVRVIPQQLGPEWSVNFPQGQQLGVRRPTAFCSIFNFEPRKNPEALLRATATLAAEGTDIQLSIKISGTEAPAFWGWATATLGEKNVELVRGVTTLFTERLRDDQLQKFLSAADVFVLPTRGEGFGLPFLEAMAMGVPSICPEVGGHRDFCDADTSYLVACRSVPCLGHWDIPLFRESRWQETDHDALVSAMRLAASDPDLRGKKAHLSRLRAEDWAQDSRRATSRALELL